MDGIIISCSSTASSHKNIIHSHTKSHHQTALENKNEDNVEEIGSSHTRSASQDVDMHLGGRLNPMFIPSVSLIIIYFLVCLIMRTCGVYCTMSCYKNSSFL